MDIGKIIQMVINILLRKVINGGINKGIGMFTNRRRSASDHGTPQDPAAVSEDPALAAKRAQQAANLAKRLR